MIFEKYLQDKQSFVFELDNVIYPEKDYLLQVYYLFAQFIEYSEQLTAADTLQYMQDIFEQDGADQVFAKTIEKFNIPEKYNVNFELLLHSVRLPLKLLVYTEVLSFLQQIVLERKQIFLFVKGNPTMQLNKIKQTEWQGLEIHLTVFFTAEYENEQDAMQEIFDQHQLSRESVLLIGNSIFTENIAIETNVDYLCVKELFII